MYIFRSESGKTSSPLATIVDTVLTGQICAIPNSVLVKGQKRRTNTEEKAKVVTAVWGREFIQFLAALAILH